MRGSAALRRVLELTLALGNFLNGGTAKGGAWGFRLDSLSKLTGTKTADGKSTLLHYMARLLDKQAAQREAPQTSTPAPLGDWTKGGISTARAGYSLSKGGTSSAKAGYSESDAVLLLREMPSIEAAARVCWADEAAEVAALQKSLTQLAALVEADSVESFKRLLGAFYEGAARAAEKLHAAHGAADGACVELAGWLAEETKGGRPDPERCFSALHTFAMALEKAHAYNIECDEKELRKERMAAAAKLREEGIERRRAASPVGVAGPSGAGGSKAGEGAVRKPLAGSPLADSSAARFGSGGLSAELTAKLAMRANRANLVDDVAEGMASGQLFLQRRQDSFARRASMKQGGKPKASQAVPSGARPEPPLKPPPPSTPPPPPEAPPPPPPKTKKKRMAPIITRL